jgi:hypothetical protein
MPLDARTKCPSSPIAAYSGAISPFSTTPDHRARFVKHQRDAEMIDDEFVA